MEKTQQHRINRHPRVGLSDQFSRIIQRMQRPRRSKPQIMYQRACFGDQVALLRTGLSEATSDKGIGVTAGAEEEKFLRSG